MNKLCLLFSFAVASRFQLTRAWRPNRFPFIPAHADDTKIRELIIEAQGHGKRILDIGCGDGYSTSSTEGSVGIDLSKNNIISAKELFPNKVFKHSFINAKDLDEEYDIVTCMFYLHDVPQYLRTKIIDSAIEIAKERVVIVDISPDYMMEAEMLERNRNIPDYIDNCRNDFELFHETVLVDGLLNMWVLNMRDMGEDGEDREERENVEKTNSQRKILDKNGKMGCGLSI